MKLEIEINNKSKADFKRVFFKSVIQKTFGLCAEEYPSLKNKNISLSVAMVSSDEIRELNRRYRKIDSATDVLSFSEFRNKKALSSDCGEDTFLGEIILCYNYIEKYSETEKNARIETVRVLSHGLLHLLGFRHGKKMFAIQDKVALDIK